jgi:hypothetical protein
MKNKLLPAKLLLSKEHYKDMKNNYRKLQVKKYNNSNIKINNKEKPIWNREFIISNSILLNQKLTT